MPAWNAYALAGAVLVAVFPLAGAADTTASSCPAASAVFADGHYIRAYGTSATDVWQESNGIPGLQVSSGVCNGKGYKYDTCIAGVFDPLWTGLCVANYAL